MGEDVEFIVPHRLQHERRDLARRHSVANELRDLFCERSYRARRWGAVVLGPIAPAFGDVSSDPAGAQNADANALRLELHRYFGASLAPRMEQAASQIQDSRVLLDFSSM